MKELANGIEKAEESMPAELRHPTDLLAIIAQAVMDPRVDVEKMERLLAMQQAIVREQRETEFKAAMTRLQAQIPQIDKFGRGKSSKYAKLEDIDVIVRPLIAAEGFNIAFNEESHTDKTVTFVMTFSHSNGHSDSKRLTVAIDTAAKNREDRAIRPAIQDSGSTVSYARRYLLKMHLNIIEKDEDTDGESRAAITDEQQKDLLAALDEVKFDKAKFLDYMGVKEIAEIQKRDWKRAMNAIDYRRRNPPKTK